MLCQLMLKMNIASIWGSTFTLPFGLGLLASDLSGSACLYPTVLGLYKHQSLSAFCVAGWDSNPALQACRTGIIAHSSIFHMPQIEKLK